MTNIDLEQPPESKDTCVSDETSKPIEDDQNRSNNSSHPLTTASESSNSHEVAWGWSKKYSDKQLNRFFTLLEEGMSVKEAAEAEGINPNTAHGYRRRYMQIRQEGAPSLKNKQEKQLLNETHLQFLAEYIDRRPDADVIETKCELCTAFEGLHISATALSKHMDDNCVLSFKRIERDPIDTVITQRKLSVLQWQEDENMDFVSNCVFLDEARFRVQVTRERARHMKDDMPNSEVSENTGLPLTVYAAISGSGVINVSTTKILSTMKESNTKGKTKEVIKSVPNSECLLIYLRGLLDVLDRAGLCKQYIVMENTPNSVSAAVLKVIKDRGHQCVYLPPQSHFLNPLEEFWPRFRSLIKRYPLGDYGRITTRLMDAVRQIADEECERWIRNSMDYFDRCVAEDSVL